MSTFKCLPKTKIKKEKRASEELGGTAVPFKNKIKKGKSSGNPL